MPWGLKRYQQARDLHFVTFSCYRRQPLLASAHAKHLFEVALERARRQYGFYITGYVIMPEHVHLLVSEPERHTLARASGGETVSGPQAHRWTYALLAGTLLRLQRVDQEKADREAKVHASQPGEAGTGGEARGLGME